MKMQHAGWKITFVTVFLMASAAGMLLAFSSGPPLARTGDFGEPTCNDSGCHSGNPLNDGVGSFTISGVPAEYQPGVSYPITVTLSRSGQQRWGFELAVRAVGSGAQAGTLAPSDGNTFVRTSNGVQYISHNSSGTFPGSGQGSWNFTWTAPSQAVGPVRFGAAGNAANGNFNPSGDFIYTLTATSNLPITGLFSQVAVGGGFNTLFTFGNTGSDTLSGRLILTKSDGTPLDATITTAAVEGSPSDVRILASETDLNIQAGGTRFVTANPVNPGDPTTTVGWARVESNGGTLSGVATFRQTGGGGNLQTVVGVLAGEKEDAVTIPVDDDASRNRFTGYAIANPEDGDVNIKILLVRSDGVLVRELSPPDLNPLGKGRHVARFLFQDLNDPNLRFQGSVVLVASGGRKFTAVALLQDRGLLTAIPVVSGKAPHLPN